MKERKIYLFKHIFSWLKCMNKDSFAKNDRFQDQTRNIVITGASSGIGAAIAFLYAGPSVNLALSGRDKVRLEKTAQLCREKGAVVIDAVMDVTDREKMLGWLKNVDRQMPVDLVIANAGISGGTGGEPGESGSTEPEWQSRRIFEVNMMGVLNTVNPLIPKMKERGRGHIALMSSLAGYRGWPGAPSYSASKAAVRIYGDGIRSGLEKHGINVSVICPGFVKSPMTDSNTYTMPFLMDTHKAAAIIQKGLRGRKDTIAFPWPTALFAKFIGILPGCVVYPLLRKLPAKNKMG